ncbi:riboflavin synthase [Paraferrimonas sp. SM1919]|uniref:riboflavin synthase n=1 Tax=Paraferrimonas sp. SM1919 TaxID=2662263 RepID=UPI0013D610C9|nr:riboflavin synthase [Paraferrimonas sp. SM1919]
MFTGIIEAVGKIVAWQQSADDVKVTIDSGKLSMADVSLGDSIATNGVCLTVTEINSNGYCADVSAETVKVTRFKDYGVGQKVNLEKAVTANTRLGGHMVSGHVDGVATCVEKSDLGKAIEFWIKPNDLSLLKYIPHKGSVTIDGISLTVNELRDEAFRLTIVPHTAAQTTLADLTVGQQVNLEVDLIARYLERLMAPTPDTKAAGLSMETLARSGFIRG